MSVEEEEEGEIREDQYHPDVETLEAHINQDEEKNKTREDALVALIRGKGEGTQKGTRRDANTYKETLEENSLFVTCETVTKESHIQCQRLCYHYKRLLLL